MEIHESNIWIVLQVTMKDQTSNINVEDLLRQSQMELQWIQRQLAMITARNIHHHHLHTKGKVMLFCTLWACAAFTAVTAKIKVTPGTLALISVQDKWDVPHADQI